MGTIDQAETTLSIVVLEDDVVSRFIVPYFEREELVWTATVLAQICDVFEDFLCFLKQVESVFVLWLEADMDGVKGGLERGATFSCKLDLGKVLFDLLEDGDHKLRRHRRKQQGQRTSVEP